MTLPELSIRRHVLAWMISAVMVLFGLIGFRDIGLDRFPEIEFPIISVTTVLPGASPEIIDASVTNLIESAVNSVPGIDYIQSTMTSMAREPSPTVGSISLILASTSSSGRAGTLR